MDILEIKTFLENLQEEINDDKTKRDKDNTSTSSDFNLFNQFFPLGENKTSEILAFFLDPNQTHGQGTIFLNSFLDKIDVSIGEIRKKVKIITEQPTDSNRRIDIFIEFGNNEYLIGIENKLWAEDQNAQLYDYNEYLKNKKTSYTLIYLTSYGKEASKISLASKDGKNKLNRDDYLRLSYQDDIIDLIDEWIQECRSQRVIFLLEDFKQYLNFIIKNIPIMGNTTEMVSEYIVKNNELKNAFEVYHSMPKIKEKLTNKLAERLRSELNFECDKMFGKKDSQAILSLNYEHIFMIMFLVDYGEMVIGVRPNDNKIVDSKSYEESWRAMKEISGIGSNLRTDKAYGNWVWVAKPTNFTNWNVSKPWLEESKEFIDFLKKIIQELNKI
tara:strand:+ start:1315 stop:2472 length:1158 start_codon:yes stop_codon:yes gene_type:complete